MTHRCIHHTADPSKAPQYEKVLAYHDSGAGGKWPKGHGIQYHRLIEWDGVVMYCAPYEKIKWHAGSVEWNNKSAGWCLAGDFRSEAPSEAQLCSLFELWKVEGFPSLTTHKEVRPHPTACPGSFDFIGEMERRRGADLMKRLKIAEKALPRSTGARLGMLLRFIDRVKRALNIT